MLPPSMHSVLLALALAAPDTSASDTPADFIDDVKLLYQVVTCQGGALPPALDPKAVEAYCGLQRPRFKGYRDHWGTTAKDFLVKLQPPGLPGELVYPFGGGDLMSALTAYPEATTITTLSLELAGDPRRLSSLKDPATLRQSLMSLASVSASTLMSNDSLSKLLSATQRGELPAQLSMHLMGLALFDLEPVSVRYFRVEPDGTLHYYTLAEVQALDGKTAHSLNADWKSPDFSEAFSNVEVQFVPRGQPQAPRRVHRHLAADLSNDGLTRKAPGVLKHLEAKGRVAAMTKAASYLLWTAPFAVVRQYLVSHAAYMVSDSTGVPPHFWKAAGCTVQAYGSFQKSFLKAWEGTQDEFRTQFAAAKPLPMRFGYPDGSEQRRSHLLSVRCPEAGLDAGIAPVR
jgi:hypothetical protein